MKKRKITFSGSILVMAVFAMGLFLPTITHAQQYATPVPPKD